MQQDEGRKRKAHTKSRKGCGNCKLRRVKCDEGKPECTKCIQYGVQCSYEANGGSAGAEAFGEHTLQLPGEGSFTFASEPPAGHGPFKPRDSLSPEQTADATGIIDSMLGTYVELHETSEKYQMTKEDVAVLKRFHYRTIYTIGTAQTVGTYRQQMLKLAAFNASCLTHIVLALTLMHDRYLDCPWKTPASSKETFHTYHGTALFNFKLCHPIVHADKDPLWGTAALLGCITIASIDATTPEEAWPLKPSSVSDLDWLRMSDGKKEVWRLVDPLRDDSVFREALSSDHQKDPEPYNHPVPELQMLFPYLTKLYSYDPSAPEHPDAAANDPYHTAASILVRLLELECNHSTIMYFLSFLGHMDPRFRELLHRKDARALLLLAWWYGKMSQYSVWWQTRRMRLEGQAICLYLEKWHGDQEDVVKLLDYPRLMTGLDRR